ncbi:GNAT family N-acetyltransferase [Streptomyces sp. NPDC056670]|uniref:GNAT family N-acetyltransferase n=1 Tax=Streptomyces sp. NPDC056670 TaxID=3345904 RepID=UPI0036C419D1
MKVRYELHGGLVTAILNPGPTATEPVTLEEIFVREEARGRGYATELLTRICSDVDAVSAVLILSVDPGLDGLTYAQLVAWYERHGFQGSPDDDVMIRPAG